MALHKVKNKLGNIKRRYQKKSGGIGVVEDISVDKISGWLVTPDDHTDRSCSIYYLGKKYTIDTSETYYRSDISDAYCAWEQECGFKFYIPDILSCKFYIDPDFKKNISVVVDGIPIKITDLNRSDDTFTITAKDKYWGFNQHSVNKEFNFLGADTFIFYLSCPKELDVKCLQLSNECAVYECMFVNDVSAENLIIRDASVEEGKKIVQVEIPGSVWLSSDKKPYNLSVLVNGNHVGFSLNLSILSLQDWTNNIVLGRFGGNSYYNTLCLEHMHYALNSGYLKEDYISCQSIQDIASQFNVKSIQRPLPKSLTGSLKLQTLSVEYKTAVNEFNDEISLGQDPISSVCKILSNNDLNDRNKLIFFTYIIPYFLFINKYNQVHSLINHSYFEKNTIEDKSWSLLLPFYFESENYDDLLVALSKVSDDPGWLNTACIEYVVRNILSNNNLSASYKVRIIDETLKIYERYSNQAYWGRLHDKNLISVLSYLIKVRNFHSRSICKRIKKIFIKFYVLSPVFWEMSIKNLPDDKELNEIYHDYSLVISCFNSKANEPTVLEAVGVLNKLIDLGSIDAKQFLEELAIKFYDKTAKTISLDPIRELSSPYFVSDDKTSKSIFPEEVIFYKTSDFYNLQKDVHKSINSAKINQNWLLDVSSALCVKSQEYIGLDMLAKYLNVIDHVEMRKILPTYKKKLEQCLDEIRTSPDTLINAPLLSSVSLVKGLLVKHQLSDEVCFNKLPEVFNDCYSPSCSTDSIVLIYSCQKNLNTRVKSIRNSWLTDLKKLGIPYLIVVGGSDENRVVDDVLYLNVEDSYESLPQKTLAMFNWVLKKTNYLYAIKIDDDCVMNVNEYFSSWSYRKFHYYGRELKHSKGSIDRLWHQGKSQSCYAKYSFDKSPEPSYYADGGSSYALSKYAMASIDRMAGLTTGKRLINTSFYEDKLVGDLLNMASIHVSDEDYFVHVYRKPMADGIPISLWCNYFTPSLNSPTKIVHTDSEFTMKRALSHIDEPGLYPSKIFPTHQNAKLGLNANQLELLTANNQVKKLLKEAFFVVSVVYNEMIIMPHFLEHYRKLGVKSFIFTDNASTDGTREFLLKQSDVVLYSADTEYKMSHYGVEWQQAMLANHCQNKWALVADADEFIVFPAMEEQGIQHYLNQLDTEGADSACLYMIDMYPYMSLENADFRYNTPFDSAPYFDRKSIKNWYLERGFFSGSTVKHSHLRHRLAHKAQLTAFVAQKIALLKYKPWMKLSEGLHYVGATKPASKPIAFAHFKYHADFKMKVDNEIERKQHYNGAEEYIEYKKLLDESNGFFGSEKFSAKYINSTQFISQVCGEL